jgi:hypothetical protein
MPWAAMKNTLTDLRSMSWQQGRGFGLQKLWKNFLTLENHISAPFRQMIMDAEGRMDPTLGI